MGAVFVKEFPAPAICEKEIFRFAGVKKPDASLTSLLNECLSALAEKISYRVVFSVFPIEKTEKGISLGFMESEAKTVQKALLGCEHAVLFGATIGLEADRFLLKQSALSSAKALLSQAIGAERIEALCDTFWQDIADAAREKGYAANRRISPGYSDFPLSAQKDIFAALACEKSIGLTLNESLIMSPSKSVTALFGLKKRVKG